jgi:transcriptional regulator
MLLQKNPQDKMELLSHMALANPHWKDLLNKGRAKAIFHGPNAYISPQWYTPSEKNVSTWNYAVVHVEGDFEIIKPADEVMGSMKKLVHFFEGQNNTNWEMPENSAYISNLIKNIVMFKLTNLTFEAKFKLSQNHDTENRTNVIEQLGKSQDSSHVSLSQYMKQASV